MPVCRCHQWDWKLKKAKGGKKERIGSTWWWVSNRWQKGKGLGEVAYGTLIHHHRGKKGNFKNKGMTGKSRKKEREKRSNVVFFRRTWPMP